MDVDYERYATDCTAFLQALVRTPSVNGKDNEGAVAKLLIAQATKLGLSTQVIEDEPGRSNVVVGEHFDSPDNLLLVAHSDTVSAGDERVWKHGPFSGEIENARLYGRGAIDCKGGIAVGLYVLTGC